MPGEFLPPVIAELRANISEYQAKMAEARGEMTATEEHGTSVFGKLSGAVAAGLVATAAVAVGVSAVAVKMASDYEDAHVRLENALTNTGSSFDQVRDKVALLEMKFETFGYNMTDTETALAKMTQITGNANTALADMGLAADIAKGKNIDLATAVQIVGLVQDGQFGRLKRLGIVLDENTIKTKNVAAAMKELEERFGGAAQAQADTFSGKMAALGANFHDLMINLGLRLIPVLQATVDWVLAVVLAFERNWPDIKTRYVQPVVDWLASYVLPIFQRIGSWLRDQWPLIVTLAGTAWTRLKQVAQIVIDWFTDTGIPLLKTALGGIITGGEAVVSWFQDHWSTIKGVFSDVWDDIQAAYQWIIDNKDSVIAAVAAVGAVMVATWLADAASAATAAAATLLAISPFLLIAAAIAAVAGAAVYAYENFDTFRNAVDAVASWFRDTLLPILKEVYGWIQDNTAKLAQYVAERWDDIQKAVHNVLTAIEIVVGAVAAVILFIWEHTHDQLVTIATAVWNVISAVIGGFITTIKDVIDIVLGLLSGDWGRAWDAMKDIVAVTWNVIWTTITSLWTAIWAFLQAGLNLFVATWQLIWDTIEGVLATAWEHIKSAISTGLAAVLKFFTDLPGNILALMVGWDTLLVGKGIELITGILTGINDKWQDLWKWFTDLPDNIANLLVNIGTALYEKGRELIQGFIDGIMSKAEDVGKAVASVIPAPVKDLIGGQPSDVQVVPLPQGALGGFIPGSNGAPTMIIAHAGEMLLNQSQQRNVNDVVWQLANTSRPVTTYGPQAATDAGMNLTLNVQGVAADPEELGSILMREASWALKARAA